MEVEDNIKASILNDDFMDSVRFITFINLVLSCSENYEISSTCLNKDNVKRNSKKRFTLCKDRNIFCPICITNVSYNEYIKELTCLHTFHKKCIDKWVKQFNNDSSIKPNCPMCRKPV